MQREGRNIHWAGECFMSNWGEFAAFSVGYFSYCAFLELSLPS